MRLADRLSAEADAFARLLTREQGKPLGQARFEVKATIAGIRYFAGLRLEREERAHSYGRYEIERRPLGVVACITPWNFPMILASNKYAAALAAGNTVVLKPAPTTPLTTLEIGRLASDIFPAGVLNVIADDNHLGAALTAHPDVAKVSFTGSTETGRKVMRAAADTVKRITLELGGNDAAIVLADADVAAAADGLAAVAFLNAGKICAAPKRLYVEDDIFDEFCENLAHAVRAMKLGAGDEEGVTLGPLQNEAQFRKVQEIIADASREGTVITGGRVTSRPGYFIEPTVVRDIGGESRLVRYEQFGPVVPVLRFSGEVEAVARANTVTMDLAPPCGRATRNNSMDQSAPDNGT